MNNSESKSVNKIPLLSAIPIIGEFFKYTSTSRDRHELVILITPTIVNSDDPLKVSPALINEVERAKEEYSTMKEVDQNELDMLKGKNDEYNENVKSTEK
jgi:pilus assembly protein CpaC